MNMTSEVIVPFRDRGIDPLRRANLDRVLTMWHDYGYEPIVADDGSGGAEQFNRSAAYNAGAAATDAEVLIFSESDMLIDVDQVGASVDLAVQVPGMVIPFGEYRYLSPEDSERIRSGDLEPNDAKPLWTMDRGRSIGAINVMSRRTLESTGGFDERFHGNWYDDNAAKRAFEVCSGPTRWIAGPAFHLYHLPGHKGEHLTADDKAATTANRLRLRKYQMARTPAQIRELVGRQ
jgi:hypothetical protein